MSKKILVVDDTIELADGLARLLNRRGYQAVTKYDSQSAIEALKQEAFDIVITDKEMRGNQDAGFEVAKAARSRSGMPIIMISAGVSEETLPDVQRRLNAIGRDIQFVDKEGIWTEKVLKIVKGEQKKTIEHGGI